MAIESSTTVEGADKPNECAETHSESDRMVEGGNIKTRIDNERHHRKMLGQTRTKEGGRSHGSVSDERRFDRGTGEGDAGISLHYSVSGQRHYFAVSGVQVLGKLFNSRLPIGRAISTETSSRVAKKTAEGVTHALFQRFSTKEDLDQYMQSPQRWRIARELVIPYYHGLVMLDFETEVEDEMEAIFRRGQAFSEGIDHAVLLKVKEGTGQESIDHMLQSFRALRKELSSAIVQLTAGTNISSVGKGYTHGFIARVPSGAALDYVIKHPAYIEALSVDVLPDGTEFISADLPVATSGSSVTLHG